LSNNHFQVVISYIYPTCKHSLSFSFGANISESGVKAIFAHAGEKNCISGMLRPKLHADFAYELTV